MERSDNHLHGVKCVVDTCYFHAQGNYCNAAKIEIKPNNAQNTHETDCATYTHK